MIVLVLTPNSRPEHVFPTLTSPQLARLRAHGKVRQVRPGEVLLETGDPGTRFFVVTAGQVDIVHVSTASKNSDGVSPRTVYRRGRRPLGQAHACPCPIRQAGEVIEIDHANLLAFVQTDSELSDIIMRAFILRRAETDHAGVGDVVLIGSSHCTGTLRIKEFLTRNGHPYVYMDLDRKAASRRMLDHFSVSSPTCRSPICRGPRAPEPHQSSRLPTVLASTRLSTRPRSATW